jgi:hypothetical protein
VRGPGTVESATSLQLSRPAPMLRQRAAGRYNLPSAGHSGPESRQVCLHDGTGFHQGGRANRRGTSASHERFPTRWGGRMDWHG